MIYNTIMVQLGIDGPAAPRIRFARQLARHFEAELIGFAAAEARPMAAAADGAIVDGELMARQIEDIEALLKELKLEFEREAEDSDRISWRGFVGSPTGLLVEQARAADLIVTGTPGEEALPDYYRTVDTGELILAAGRPVLIASQEWVPIAAERIVLGWKDTREARRATADAMPFLARAKEVLVAAVDGVDTDEQKESVVDVLRYLMRHGVKARSDVLHTNGRNVSEVLADTARQMDADLIVAGGYGHTRLREWAFGGVTRQLLQDGMVHRLISN